MLPGRYTASAFYLIPLVGALMAIIAPVEWLMGAPQ